MAQRGERGPVPVAFGLSGDGVLHAVHGAVQVAAVDEKGRQLGVAR